MTGFDLRFSHIVEPCESDIRELLAKTSQYFDLNVYIPVNFTVAQVKKEKTAPGSITAHLACQASKDMQNVSFIWDTCGVASYCSVR